MSDGFVIHGPEPLKPIPKDSLGKQIYDGLLSHIDKSEAVLLATTNESVSYKQILEKTCRLALSFLRCGYSKNDVISVCSENSIPFFYPVISALYLGMITATLNYDYSIRELRHGVDISKPKIIFCSKAVLKKVLGLKRDVEYIQKVIILDSPDDYEEAESFENFLDRNSDPMVDLIKFRPANLDPKDHVAFIMGSSGTTGLPKGVMLTHTNIAVRMIQSMDPRFNIEPTENCLLVVLPCFHAYGLITTLEALIKGLPVIMLQKFQEELFLKIIEKYKISAAFLVPPLMVFLAKSPLVDKYDLSSIKDLVCGAAPLSKETEQAVRERLNVPAVRQGYGLTEATMANMVMPLGETRNGSSGKIFPYVSAKVIDTQGNSLGPLQEGELCLKGALVMKGYFKNDEATRSVIDEEGWVHTGDIAYYDEDEYFYIVDRIKELIKYKGFQVPPAEIEAILLTHPKIKDSAVIGKPDEVAGELPVAFVVQTPDANLTEDEVKKFVAGQISHHKQLHGGVIFVEQIPKTPSGKLLRRELKDRFKKLKSKL